MLPAGAESATFVTTKTYSCSVLGRQVLPSFADYDNSLQRLDTSYSRQFGYRCAQIRKQAPTVHQGNVSGHSAGRAYNYYLTDDDGVERNSQICQVSEALE